jgi:hypothetical protein
MSAYLSQKEEVLLARIEKAKQQLHLLKQNQKLALGELAFDCGLHLFDFKSLSTQFEQIAKTLGGEYAR